MQDIPTERMGQKDPQLPKVVLNKTLDFNYEIKRSGEVLLVVSVPLQGSGVVLWLFPLYPLPVFGRSFACNFFEKAVKG